KWYVIYTRPRWEKRVANDLEENGIEHYCPLTKVEKQWSDRKKWVLEPLFKGYVFVRLSSLKKWDVKLQAGVINFVYWLGKPAIVNDNDILTIRKFLNEFEEVTLEKTGDTFKPNGRIVVATGVLMNYQGMILEIQGKKVKVLLQSMSASLVAVFKKGDLKRISK